jgi:hypothetical protein
VACADEKPVADAGAGHADAAIEDRGAPRDADEAEAGPDAASDAGIDAAIDAGVDAEIDSGIDAGEAEDAADAGEPPDLGADGGINEDGAVLPSRYDQHPIDEARRHGQGARVVDIENDGDQDVIVGWSLADAVYLYLNDGSGTFTTKNVSGDGAIVAMHTATGDFDDDLDRDIAAIGLFDRVGMGFDTPGELVWYENPGAPTGNWIAHPVADDLWGLRYIEAGDLTGDGRPDLVVSAVVISGMSAGIRWFRGGNDAFAGPFDVDANVRVAETIQLADVDLDGVLDVVGLDREADEVFWYESSRPAGMEVMLPTFTRRLIGGLIDPYGLAIADFDGDAELELAVSSDDRLDLFDPPANPRDPWTASTIDGQFGSNGNTRLAAGDFNDDGATDLAVSAQSPAEIRVYINDRGTWVGQTVTGGWQGANFVATGDIDPDDYDDIVTTTYENTSTADKITWWRTVP